ncbi:MAG: right-handed parallel beta-helix repeat-containing protein [Phycisphaerae bacterium]|nr:right-handed parallel beta-helix repeat-containing protein [Phycisphaerae bacterium]
MNRKINLASTSVLLVMCAGAAGAEDKTLVFPSAKGFGIHTPAGKGGKVVRVTNLNAEGPGSLRDALRTKGPRIVVFEVGGVIDLNGKGIDITQPFLTVAGQTAPSPGITLIRGGISISAHDVLIQHIRVRPGDAGRPKKSGWEPDGISTSGAEAYNVVIDHCSITWAVDENLSASGPRSKGPEATSHKITFSNCIIAEGLNNSSHSKGPHSKGSLIHDNCREIAVIGNLYAHNVQRNPYFKAFTTGVVVGNVIYNPGSVGVQVNYADSEWKGSGITPRNCRISVVGNVLICGADTRQGLALVTGRGDVYMKDNIATRRDGAHAPLSAGKVNLLDRPPVWPEGLDPLPAKDVLEHVIAHVGARPKDRDDVDKRIIRDLRERKGRIIDSQDDVGGYPKQQMTRHALRVPETGIDEWLAGLAR